jgi:hypothetical protein
MTEIDKAKALKTLAATEMVTGMDLSSVIWGVSRQQTDAALLDNDTNPPVVEEEV